MISKFNLHRVRLMEFVQVMKNIKGFLEKEDLHNMGLSQVKSDFDLKYTALEEAIKPLLKNENTEKIQELDAKRDALWVGFLAYIRGWLAFPEEDKAQAANKLLLIAENYGKNIQQKPFQEETAIINSVLQDLAKPENSPLITLIGAEIWVQGLSQANQAFEQLHNDRTEEQGTLLVGKTREARKEMNEVYTKLIKTLNAFAYINGEALYQNLANTLNEEIGEAIAQAERRKTIATKNIEKKPNNSGDITS